MIQPASQQVAIYSYSVAISKGTLCLDGSFDKWKNHFYEMKGYVGMSLHEKERNKKMPTPRRSSVGIYAERKTISWCPCTPPSTVERFGEKISAEACSGKEIAGLLKKMMMMKNMMTRKSRNCI